MITIANSINRDEKFALSRDAFGREDPDRLLSGFFAPWPLVLFLIAGFFCFINLKYLLVYFKIKLKGHLAFYLW